jgi:hypothetical protein
LPPLFAWRETSRHLQRPHKIRLARRQSPIGVSGRYRVVAGPETRFRGRRKELIGTGPSGTAPRPSRYAARVLRGRGSLCPDALSAEPSIMPAGVWSRHKLIGGPKVLVSTPAFRRWEVAERPYGPPPITIVSSIVSFRPGPSVLRQVGDVGTSGRLAIRTSATAAL